MMTTLFYIMACFFIVHETMKIGCAKDLCSELTDIDKYNKENKVKKRFSSYSSMVQSYTVIQIVYFIWSLVGLITSQMPIFLVFILIGLINKNKTWIMTLNGYIRIIILALILINKYTLHIDFIKLLIR